MASPKSIKGATGSEAGRLMAFDAFHSQGKMAPDTDSLRR
jgi:hypothetical protein